MRLTKSERKMLESILLMVLSWAFLKYLNISNKYKKIIHEYLKKNEKIEKAYWSERKGRAMLLKRLQDEISRRESIENKISSPHIEGSFKEVGGENDDKSFKVMPIGFVQSCYRQCIGTPRQGLLVPKSRASIVLIKRVSPESFVGLEDFSHVWLTFKFHLNSNVHKEADLINDKRSTFNGKITLPVLKSKLGVFSTRSPHRPNPIGITLAKVSKVDKSKKTLFLTACDLVDGTPILDIKPYVPAYDTVPSFMIPDWIKSTVDTRNIVTIADDCKEYVYRIQSKLKQYKNEPDEYIEALIQTLEAEVRSKFQTNKRIENSKDGQMIEVPFDETYVSFFWLEERTFQIANIRLK